MKRIIAITLSLGFVFLITGFQIADQKIAKLDDAKECTYLKYHSSVNKESKCPYLKNKETAKSNACPYVQKDKNKASSKCPYLNGEMKKQSKTGKVKTIQLKST